MVSFTSDRFLRGSLEKSISLKDIQSSSDQEQLARVSYTDGCLITTQKIALYSLWKYLAAIAWSPVADVGLLEGGIGSDEKFFGGAMPTSGTNPMVYTAQLIANHDSTAGC